MPNVRIDLEQAREQLPELVRQVGSETESSIEITVRGETVAELRRPARRPGAAAERLRALMADHPSHRGPKHDISGRVGEILYGKGSK